MKKLSQEEAISISQEFIDKLRFSGINIRHAFLYGSYLRNEQREYSDIDVAIIAEEFTGILPLDLPIILNILKDYSIIHAKTYSMDDWINGEPFLDEIVKAGLELN